VDAQGVGPFGFIAEGVEAEYLFAERDELGIGIRRWWRWPMVIVAAAASGKYGKRYRSYRFPKVSRQHDGLLCTADESASCTRYAWTAAALSASSSKGLAYCGCACVRHWMTAVRVAFLYIGAVSFKK
jgi:hypothetical protein